MIHNSCNWLVKNITNMRFSEPVIAVKAVKGYNWNRDWMWEIGCSNIMWIIIGCGYLVTDEPSYFCIEQTMDKHYGCVKSWGCWSRTIGSLCEFGSSVGRRHKGYLPVIKHGNGKVCTGRWFLSITLWLWLIEGSLEVKLPTIWTDEKQRWEQSERREE